MTRVWLLTGASRGLGRAITETVLAAGERWKPVSLSVDFGAPEVLPAFPEA